MILKGSWMNIRLDGLSEDILHGWIILEESIVGAVICHDHTDKTVTSFIGHSFLIEATHKTSTFLKITIMISLLFNQHKIIDFEGLN